MCNDDLISINSRRCTPLNKSPRPHKTHTSTSVHSRSTLHPAQASPSRHPPQQRTHVSQTSRRRSPKARLLPRCCCPVPTKLRQGWSSRSQPIGPRFTCSSTGVTHRRETFTRSNPLYGLSGCDHPGVSMQGSDVVTHWHAMTKVRA